MPYVRWFEELTIHDVPLVGGKNASLGELQRALGPKGIGLARGFAMTAEAYREFLKQRGLGTQIRELLAGLDTTDLENLQARGRRVRHAILSAELPREVENQLISA